MRNQLNEIIWYVKECPIQTIILVVLFGACINILSSIYVYEKCRDAAFLSNIQGKVRVVDGKCYVMTDNGVKEL